MYKQHFPMLNSIWPKIGLGPLFYSGIQLLFIRKISRQGKTYILLQAEEIMSHTVEAKSVYITMTDILPSDMNKYQYLFIILFCKCA